MTDPAENSHAPRKILLAADLSARGDLMIVHVFEEIDESNASYRAGRGVPSWRRPPDAAAILKTRVGQGLRADLGAAIERATIKIEVTRGPIDR